MMSHGMTSYHLAYIIRYETIIIRCQNPTSTAPASGEATEYAALGIIIPMELQTLQKLLFGTAGFLSAKVFRQIYLATL